MKILKKPYSYNDDNKRLAHRQICQLCGGICRVDFVVSAEHWELGMPKELWNKHICLECYTRQADERYVPWCESISFKPMSMIKHVEEMFNWGQLELIDEKNHEKS
jgi:ribosomal protein L40E